MESYALNAIQVHPSPPPQIWTPPEINFFDVSDDLEQKKNSFWYKKFFEVGKLFIKKEKKKNRENVRKLRRRVRNVQKLPRRVISENRGLKVLFRKPLCKKYD